jgi:outer membrane lipoprotein-sorting protein
MPTLNRRTLASAALALTALAAGLGWTAPGLAQPAPAASALSPDDQALVDKAVAYLGGLGEAKGRFIQTEPNGGQIGGEVYLARPGRARFAYDAPSNRVVVSDGHNVSVADPRLKTFDRYPLGATPLALFLAKDVRMDKGVRVERVDHTADGFSLTAREARHPRAGQVTLSFSEHPMRLTEWRLANAQGQVTTVRILNLTETSGLDPDLFVARDPRAGDAQ